MGVSTVTVELSEQQLTEIALLILEKYGHGISVKQHIMLDAMNKILENLHTKVMENEVCNSNQSARESPSNCHS